MPSKRVVFLHQMVFVLLSLVVLASAGNVTAQSKEVIEGARKEGQLAYMVGGDKEWVEKCRPVLSASGEKLFHVGQLGKGWRLSLPTK